MNRVNKIVKVGKYRIKNFKAPFMVAEIGSNHNGDIKLAKKLIDEAVRCGCHSVKFQAWRKQTLFSKPMYAGNRTLEKDIDQYAFELKIYKELKKHCGKKRIIFSSSVFSKKEVDFCVDELDMELIKIASMDVNNYPFLEYVAKKGKPIALSTGLASLAEIAEAYELITKYNKNLILLHCVALYPPKDKQVNLNNIDMLRDAFDCPIGFSDHTLGTAIPLASVVKGACLIEKHFTLDKKMAGWDHAVSADPEDMKIIVSESRRIAKALGSYKRIIDQDRLEKRKVFRRSIVAVRDLKKGQKLTKRDIELLRPGTGLEPKYLNQVLNRRLRKNLRKGELLKMADLR